LGRRDTIRFYEINPDVVELAASLILYLPTFASHRQVDTKVGDAPLLLEHEAQNKEAQNFDVLVLDAFAADAVPVHLLTTEAFDTYWKST
jgi:spermidine synthase